MCDLIEGKYKLKKLEKVRVSTTKFSKKKNLTIQCLLVVFLSITSCEKCSV